MKSFAKVIVNILGFFVLVGLVVFVGLPLVAKLLIGDIWSAGYLLGLIVGIVLLARWLKRRKQKTAQLP